MYSKPLQSTIFGGHSSPNGEHETAFPLKLRSSHATDDSGRSSSWQQPMTTSSTSKYLQSCKSIWLLLELRSESFATLRSYDACLPESPNELAHFRASTNELQLQWHLRKLPGFFSDMRYRGKQDDTCSPPWNQHNTWKLMVERIRSFCDGLFSVAMWVSGSV